MLYKKLVSVTIYAFLVYTTFGSVYYVSNHSGSDFRCNDNNRCHIYCDESDKINGYTFNCGNVSECYFHCDENKCAEQATINASNSNNLYITMASNGQECLKNATVNTPNNGNAYFSMESLKGFKEMNVYSGSNTNIIINCDSPLSDKDDCKQMNVKKNMFFLNTLNITKFNNIYIGIDILIH